MATYTIREESLVAIADAIRAKKETTALFSPEQMAAEIESLAMGNDLPNAEDDYFGTQNGYEYGLLSGTFGQSFTQDLNMGMVFTPTETFGFYGFRVYSCQSGASIVMNLYDDETKETLATLTRTPDVAEAWVDYAIAEPINLIAGKQYMVAYRTKYWKKGNSDFTYNSKITFSKYLYYYESSYPQWPCHNAGVDMLIGEVIGASVTPEYKIQLETITEIADEIRRISGVTGTISPSQMIALLKAVNA